MQITGNTILITGGGSGIGRGLAEALHKAGNQIIIAGRRQATLNDVTRANSGMESMTLDIEDPGAIKAFAQQLISRFPKLNVLMNNAGISKPENFANAPFDLSVAESTIATNLLGPIRLTAALLPHLLKQKRATILNTTSGLAFVPLPAMPTYNASKAALHSLTVVLRHQLKNTPVEVLELAPPYVQTELGGEKQKADPRAMPLAEFVAEVMTILKTAPANDEILVERVKPMRYAERDRKFDEQFGMLAKMSEEFM